MDAFHQWALGDSIFSEPQQEYYNQPTQLHQDQQQQQQYQTHHQYEPQTACTSYLSNGPLPDLLLHQPPPQQPQQADPQQADDVGKKGAQKRANRLDPRARRLHQRRAANQRERKRMRSINAAFDGLRRRLPVEQTEERKLSKVETLKYAIQYIQNLADVLSALEESEARANPNYKKRAKVILLCRQQTTLPRELHPTSSGDNNSSSGSAHTFEPDLESSESRDTDYNIDDDSSVQQCEVWGHALTWRDDRQLDPDCRIRCPMLEDGEDDADWLDEADGHNRSGIRRQYQHQHQNHQQRRSKRIRAALWMPNIIVSGVWCGSGNGVDEFDSLQL